MVVLVGLCILDLTTKYIALFFVLILIANYLNFIGFIFILRNVPTEEGQKLRKNTTIYMWVMNGLYIVVVFLACTWLRPVC